MCIKILQRGSISAKMKAGPNRCEAQQAGVIQYVPINKMQWKEVA